MRCDELGEFVSAMCDGEPVPQEAADHFSHCAACQATFQRFVKTGAELRRFAALQNAEPLPKLTWAQPQRTITGWWEKGWQMMKIPRIVFASLALLLLLVGSRLAVVEVRARDTGSVLLLKIGMDDGSQVTCPLSATDPNNQECAGITKAGDGGVTYFIHFLKKDGDRALLSLRSEFARQAISTARNNENSMPETQVWVTTGEAAETSLGGVVKVKLIGQWTDHVPISVGDNEYIDPSANELRVASPLLLKNDHVVGDMEGSTSYNNNPQRAVTLYISGEGRFSLSLTQIKGSIAAKVMMNRISFTSNGHQYVIVTGAPVARSETVWVKHDPSYKPASDESNGFLGGAALSEL